MAKSGDVYNAVIMLQNILKELHGEKTTSSQLGRVGGAGVGALIGSVIFPGVGTLIGSAIGGLLGDTYGQSRAITSAFEAETHYRLGVIYEMMRDPTALSHYMQTRQLDPTHKKVKEALSRLQPTIPISPQLAALDDEV